MPIPTRDELRTLRDDLKVRIHLGSKEVQQTWENLEERWRRFQTQAELDKTASNVGTAGQLLAEELKAGYERLKKGL